MHCLVILEHPARGQLPWFIPPIRMNTQSKDRRHRLGGAIGRGPKAVAFGVEQGSGLIVDRHEQLRFEPAHDLFSAPRLPMRSLGTIVRPFVLSMLGHWGQFGRRGGLVPAVVNKNIKYIAAGIDCPARRAIHSRIVPSETVIRQVARRPSTSRRPRAKQTCAGAVFCLCRKPLRPGPVIRPCCSINLSSCAHSSIRRLHRAHLTLKRLHR